MYRDKLDKLKSNYNMKLGEKNKIEKENKKNIEDKDKLEELVNNNNRVGELLNSVSAEARSKAIGQLESVVTSALQYVSNEGYSFKIEMLDRGRPSCEFYVVSEINGVESIQKPQDACGGGFVDIISTALRYTYLNAFDDPKINGPMVLDEPGKMVSEQASVKFAEFIKFLGSSFDRQTIMVTHNESLLNVADSTHIIEQRYGVSDVVDMNALVDDGGEIDK